MPAPESILQKIKLLINLQHSPNPNESENAATMVAKLVAKYEITEEELKSLEEKKPLYGEDDKLYVTIGLVGWKQQLALAIASHFQCKIVQEELVPGEGFHQFSYFVYGDPQDSENVKFVFNILSKKVEELIKIKCFGRGPVYIASYGEGAVESIKNNIYWDGIELPAAKVPSRQPIEEEKTLNNGTSNLSKVKVEKEKPAEASVDVNSQSLIKDINAFYSGLDHGRNISLEDLLELEAENEKSKELSDGNV